MPNILPCCEARRPWLPFKNILTYPPRTRAVGPSQQLDWRIGQGPATPLPTIPETAERYRFTAQDRGPVGF